MDETTLQAFSSVCRSGSISRSAIELHRSQSSLSRRVAQLERDVGHSLLERSANGVRVTPAGRVFLGHVDAALAALGDGRRAVTDLMTSMGGTVSICVVGTLASPPLSLVLRAFADEHPDVDIDLATATSAGVVEAVARGAADVGIGFGMATLPGVTSDVLYEDELWIACRHDDDLAGREVDSLEDLRDRTWLTFPDRRPVADASARLIGGLLAGAGVSLDDIRVIDGLTAQLRLIEAGFGIGLLPSSNVAEQVRCGAIGIVSCRGLPTIPVYLTTRDAASLTHATCRVIDLLRRERTGR